MFWMRAPYLIATSPAASVAGLRIILNSWKSILPMRRPTTGLMMSFTTDCTIAVKAAPTTIPTAMSRTLPRMMNFLNSAMKPVFFSAILFSFTG